MLLAADRWIWWFSHLAPPPALKAPPTSQTTPLLCISSSVQPDSQVTLHLCCPPRLLSCRQTQHSLLPDSSLHGVGVTYPPLLGQLLHSLLLTPSLLYLRPVMARPPVTSRSAARGRRPLGVRVMKCGRGEREDSCRLSSQDTLTLNSSTFFFFSSENVFHLQLDTGKLFSTT